MTLRKHSSTGESGERVGGVAMLFKYSGAMLAGVAILGAATEGGGYLVSWRKGRREAASARCQGLGDGERSGRLHATTEVKDYTLAFLAEGEYDTLRKIKAERQRKQQVCEHRQVLARGKDVLYLSVCNKVYHYMYQCIYAVYKCIYLPTYARTR